MLFDSILSLFENKLFKTDTRSASYQRSVRRGTHHQRRATVHLFTPAGCTWKRSKRAGTTSSYVFFLSTCDWILSIYLIKLLIMYILICDDIIVIIFSFIMWLNTRYIFNQILIMYYYFSQVGGRTMQESMSAWWADDAMSFPAKRHVHTGCYHLNGKCNPTCAR